jgi:hypothetical protein
MVAGCCCAEAVLFHTGGAALARSVRRPQPAAGRAALTALKSCASEVRVGRGVVHTLAPAE